MGHPKKNHHFAGPLNKDTPCVCKYVSHVSKDSRKAIVVGDFHRVLVSLRKSLQQRVACFSEPIPEPIPVNSGQYNHECGCSIEDALSAKDVAKRLSLC